MQLFNWWKRWKKGDAVCKVANAESLNRVYNVLEDLEVIGLNGIDAQINKPTDAAGRGWTITIDGYPITGGEWGGGGGGSGYTGSLTVVTDVSWDNYNHKLVQSKVTLSVVNGKIQAPPAAVASDIVTFVEEMP